MKKYERTAFLALPVLGALGAAIIGLAIKAKGGSLQDMAVPTCTVFVCMGLLSISYLLVDVADRLQHKQQ